MGEDYTYLRERGVDGNVEKDRVVDEEGQSAGKPKTIPKVPIVEMFKGPDGMYFTQD